MVSHEQYINPKFNQDNIDRYYARASILKVIKNSKVLLKGKLLDVGCGIMPYKSIISFPAGNVTHYIGLDFDNPITDGYAVTSPDITWDGVRIPLNDSSIDSILLTEVLEHCFDPYIVISECFRVLKPTGYIVITVPFLWPLHDIPFDAYRYTPYSLDKILNSAGFENIEIKGLGGWNASLGQMMALWLNRSGIRGFKKRIIYCFFNPIIKWLYKNDIKPYNFTDNVYMITGLSATAKKQ